MNVKLAFLSSTVKGLESCREAAKNTINGLDGWKCIGMEDFGADPETPIDKCLARLKDCNLYVGILGNRYGDVHPQLGKSYTELEYDEALRLKIKPLMFLATGDFKISMAERESDDLHEKQKEFRSRIAQHTGHFIAEFDNSDRLGAAVAKAIANQVIKDTRVSASDEEDTWLLVPFVTNQLGMDTGLAVTNPDLTVLGLSSKAGACTIFYFGYFGPSTIPPIPSDVLNSINPPNISPMYSGGLMPVAQRSQPVPVGEQLGFTLSSGGVIGMAATPGFQGYLLIRCEFPNGRAVVSISPFGEAGGSIYLAEVIKK